jgi:predicted nucleic acid-binding protein
VYLLDTNVVSELPRARPDPHVVAWVASLESIALSSITVEELVFGIERAAGRDRTRLRQWLDALLGVPPRIVAVDERVARIAGELRAAREAAGRRVAQADMLIAACALAEGLVLATRNVRDFTGCGVALLDPFRSSSL